MSSQSHLPVEFKIDYLDLLYINTIQRVVAHENQHHFPGNATNMRGVKSVVGWVCDVLAPIVKICSEKVVFHQIFV